MDITGRLIQILQEESGEGKNGRWAKCGFVIETQEKFPKKVCLTAWNDRIGPLRAFPIDTEIKVSFDVSSREYNGRWYTDLTAWKVESSSGAPSGSSQNSGPEQIRNTNTNYSNSQPSTNATGADSYGGSQERHISEDDLPF